MIVIVQCQRSQMTPVVVPCVALWYVVVSGSCPGMCLPAATLKQHNGESLLVVFLFLKQ